MAPTPRRWFPALLVAFISLIVVAGTIGGFLIGRRFTRDALIERLSGARATENATLASAGTAPLSLFQVIGKSLDDPLAAQAIARAYGVPEGDRARLVARLRDIVWLPPYRPAPFVGHMARPFFGDDLHINLLGFRDERHTYVDKAKDTVRIFLTGGSVAWGTGASTQKHTIASVLERLLNEQVGPRTGYRYEVVNTGFPGWSTTQEKILIQQRLLDLHPDVVLMLSGSNDVHWAIRERDIRWHYNYMEENHVRLLNEIYRGGGSPEWTVAVPFSSRPVECVALSRATARNVEGAARLTEEASAHLIFALQPNIVSTRKRLTSHEKRILGGQDKRHWDACYQSLREELARIRVRNYRFLDVSPSFGSLDETLELFVDGYHFADAGHQLIARALADQIDWPSIVPRAGPPATTEALVVVELEPGGLGTRNPASERPGATATIRVVPNRLNKNLVIVFDRSVLPTVMAGGSLTAAVPASLYAGTGPHAVYVADGVTGERSRPVVFERR